MSDRQKHVVLPPRGHISTMAGGLTNTPGAYDVTELARLHYSGIAVFRSLFVWQDNISKQVFWWAGYTDNTEIYPNNDNKELWDCHVIVPSSLEMFEHFFLGWGCEYHYDAEKPGERLEMLERIKTAVNACPLSEDDIYRLLGYTC